jgi:hypothetical protein
VHVRWDTARHLPLYTAEEAACGEIVRALGGHLAMTPTWRYLRQPVSVHNLGGCRMADNPAAGVVDTDGQVFGYPGLYVLDGAILPAATGVNPSHTITAVAERCAETAIRRITGTPTWTAPQRSETRPADRPEDGAITEARPLLRVRHGLGFSETMRGRALVQAGQGAGPSLRPASFTVAVTIPDLGAFLADPLHTASVAGLVTIAGITSAPAIRTQRLPLHDITAGGRHIHHYLPGIVLLTAAGGIGVRGSDKASVHCLLGATYGTGCALITDELPLLLDLRDVYWTPEGRWALDVALAIIASAGAYFSGIPLWHGLREEIKGKWPMPRPEPSLDS